MSKRLAPLILFCLAVPTFASVQQWDTFETTLHGPSDGNPFTDVTLSARFEHNKRTITVAGFYDGDGAYKIRFMPSEPGDWQYTTVSNRPELSAQSGHFTCVEATQDNHGPVRVWNTFHFAYADTSPYFEIGTTCYGWTFQSDAMQEQTLQTLKSSPFNKVRMLVLPAGGDPAPVYPFEGAPPDHWDFTRFNPKFFQHLEKRVGDLRGLNIQADLILFHPYDKGRLGLDRMDAAGDDRYVRYVVARLAGYRNVWWSLANEFDLIRSKTDADWDRLFQIVKANDPYGHLRSIHHSERLYNYTKPWVTHASLQNGSAVADFGRAELYRDVYNKPIVFDEVKYEGDLPKRWGQLTPREMVACFWQGTISGTYVGHGETYRGGPAWTSVGGALRGQSPPRLAFLKKIVEAAPPEGIDPIDKWQDLRTAGKAGEYYLIYFGSESPGQWQFELPKAGLRAGMVFQVEILDTWNMTITPVSGEFKIVADGEYRYHAEGMPIVKLPGKPYIALRITRVKSTTAVLGPEDFKHYIDTFNAMDPQTVVNLIPNSQAWAWMKRNVPLFECPDKTIEEMYYFRWWTYRKHIKQTDDGIALTEFLARDPVSSAIGHHIMEGRWIRDDTYLDQDISYWLVARHDQHKYSSWTAWAAYQRYLVNKDKKFIVSLLNAMVRDDQAWDRERMGSDGLYWQYQARDAMEDSINGTRKDKGRRPSINSYMFGNATAIAAVAELAGDPDLAAAYRAKAERIKKEVQEKLWDPGKQFFMLRGEDGSMADAREEVGFIPWYFELPDPVYEAAWGQLTDPRGFWAPFGITTAERRNPRFRMHGSGHSCEWDGAVWPFATSQTLTAMANVLNDYPQSPVTKADFVQAMHTYAMSQRLDGKPYIGEYLDETTGTWLRDDLERGRYYNHSTFCDLVITGLVGLRPRADDKIVVNPLATWDWFCLDNVWYHGRTLTIIWDRTGKKYGRGAGLTVLED
jgi:Domain of unknown function (DUF5060)/Domain of unknown function (DUF5605)